MTRKEIQDGIEKRRPEIIRQAKLVGIKTPEWWNDLYTDCTGQCYSDADNGL